MKRYIFPALVILLTIFCAVRAVVNFVEGDPTWGTIMLACMLVDGYWAIVLTAEARDASRS